MKVTLFRPTPSTQDLNSFVTALPSSIGINPSLLTQLYEEIYKSQNPADFFGLRDFYYFLNTLCLEMEKNSDQIVLSIYYALKRNFGGLSQDEKSTTKKKFSVDSIFLSQLQKEELEYFQSVHFQKSVTSLIHDNVNQLKSRHLMLISYNEAAKHFLPTLFPNRNLIVLQGGLFPKESLESQMYYHLMV